MRKYFVSKHKKKLDRQSGLTFLPGSLENNTDYTLEGENIVTSQNEKSTKEPERYDTSYKLTWTILILLFPSLSIV